MGSLMQQISGDIARILGDAGGFAIPVIFSVTNGKMVTAKTVNAVVTVHGLYINEQGVAVMTGTARIMVSESNLVAAGFPVRNDKNALALKGDTVTFTDTVTGIQSTWVINQQFGNNMTGLITCTLGAFGAVTPPGRLIIGWMPAPIEVFVTATPGTGTQTLANRDVILTDYSMNMDRTLTIPYMVGYQALTSFLINGREIQSIIYSKPSGTFSNAKAGGFNNSNRIKFDASIPIWS